MSFRAQPDVAELAARPHAHRYQRAVDLVARGDAHELAGQAHGFGREILHDRLRLGVEVVEDRAVGGVGEELQRQRARDRGLRVRDRQHRKVLGDGERLAVGGHLRHRAVGVSQHQAREVAQRMMAHRPVEVHRPQRGASRRKRVADDERRVGKIELQVERVVLTRADGQRGVKGDVHGHGEVAARALLALDMDVAGRDAGSGGERKAAFGVCGDRQQQVTGIGADGEHRPGIGADRHAHIAEDLAQLIQLLEIHVRRGGGCGPHRHRAAATLRHECDAQQLHADGRPVVRRRIADGQRHGA